RYFGARGSAACRASFYFDVENIRIKVYSLAPPWRGRGTERYRVFMWAFDMVEPHANLPSLARAHPRSAKIAIDETVVPVLDPGRGRTKKGYFWAVARARATARARLSQVPDRRCHSLCLEPLGRTDPFP